LIGTVLSDRYEIKEKLGGGGMAVVYKAEDILLDRPVAVKVLREQFASDETFVQRFRREAQAGARLSHPNIVSIYDVGKQGDCHFLVMEFVEGRNLKEIINEKGIFEEKEVINIGAQLCEALEHAHENGLVHRDIKPHNILITNKGKVKVTDFGIARACSSETITFTGSMIGSVHYFSPEQAKGCPADVKSDIYAASVVLYELATGQLPFTADSMVSIALKHISEAPKPPRQVNPSISPELESIILKGMRKNAEDRYSSAGEMREELARLYEGTFNEALNEKPALYQNRKKLRPVGWVALSIILLILIFGGYYGALGFLKVEETEVPDVLNMSLERATSILHEAGLRTEVTDKRHHPDIPEGYVITQEPESGKNVKKNRVVELVISLGPSTAKVPNVKGQALREAEIMLTNAGFKVSPQTSFVFDSEIPKDVVIKQIPDAGSLEEQGTEIVLIVSKGPEPHYIEMPDLKGLSFAQAEEKLKEARLKLGTVSERESSEFFSGQVISQDIPAGTSVLQGYSVNLVVSKGPGPLPQFANVSVPIPDDGKKHRIRIEVFDAKGTHEEYNDLHDPGETLRTRIPFYVSGTVKIFRDGEMIYVQPVP